jgi:hypothetical protein
VVTEDEVPVLERYLWLEGFPSQHTLREVRRALPTDISKHSRICLVGFAYADIPLPKQYDVLFPFSHAESFCASGDDEPLNFKSSTLAAAIECKTHVIAALPEFGGPVTELERGWKSICAVEFEGAVPPEVDLLPTVDTWHESNHYIALCSCATFASLIDASCAE